MSICGDWMAGGLREPLKQAVDLEFYRDELAFNGYFFFPLPV
jgi:hypothetical protein